MLALPQKFNAAGRLVGLDWAGGLDGLDQASMLWRGLEACGKTLDNPVCAGNKQFVLSPGADIRAFGTYWMST